MDGVIEIYKPKSFLVEKSTIFYHSLGKGYVKTPLLQKHNCSNILSQYYSRTACKNIFLSYCQTNKVKYDIVIATRFDINIISFPETLDANKIVFSRFHMERPLVFNDNIVICSSENFLKLFNLFPNINKYVLEGPSGEPKKYEDSPDKERIFGGTVINSEELLCANLIDNNLFDFTEKSEKLQSNLY